MNFRNPIVIHYVQDMDRALAFYSAAFGARVMSASPGWSILDLGPIELALHILHPGQHEEGPIPHAGLNLEVDLIESVRAEIEAAGGQMLDLREAEPRIPVRVASFQDPDGNGFELRQGVEEAKS